MDSPKKVSRAEEAKERQQGEAKSVQSRKVKGSQCEISYLLLILWVVASLWILVSPFASALFLHSFPPFLIDGF